jgi:hypothetical protein
LEFEDQLTEKELPDINVAHQTVLQLAKKVKLARALEKFACPKGEQGCFACKPFEKVLRGEAELVGVDNYNHDVYIIPSDETALQESLIL